MSVGFGFSAGDFIAALELVHTVINALRESGNSSSEFRELISQLFTLETALIAVKNIDLDDVQHSEVVALQQAASQCQRTIDAFWEKIKKYQPHLRSGGSGSRVKDGWMRVKWTLCIKEDLVKFKADLMGHTESIEMLLTTVQMAATRIDSRKNDNHHQTLAGKVQDSYFGCMQRMSVILERVTNGIQQGKTILEMTAKIFQQNVQIFQIVLNMQSIIMKIPGQVERQQPVYFIDAIGRHMAFHLEFVLSAEALTSVLRSNFKNIGPGVRKIDKGEFAIQDSITKKDIDLSLPWETCFTPGQHADMSMVFNSVTSSDNCCPSVTTITETILRKIKTLSVLKDANGYGTTPRTPKSPAHTPQRNTLKRQALHDEDEEIAMFRRVRIRRMQINRRRQYRTPSSQTPLAGVQKEDGDLDPYADPHLVRMLENEKKLDAEMADAANSTPLVSRLDRDEDMHDDPDLQELEREHDFSNEFDINLEILRREEFERELETDQLYKNLEIEEALRRDELEREFDSAEYYRNLGLEEERRAYRFERNYESLDEFDQRLEIEEALRRQELDREAGARALADAQAELEAEVGWDEEAEEVLGRQEFENDIPYMEEEREFNPDDYAYDYEEMMMEDSNNSRS